MREVFNIETAGKEQEDIAVLEDIGMGGISELLVYNDDHNTFDWVIECLVDLCGHTHTQAEQLSLIIHFKGKACVKIAPLDVLRPIKNSLAERGLSVVIEGTESEA